MKRIKTNTFTHGSLFSGIGGFDLAAEWMGWENVFSCEINPFSRKVLKYYWPNTKHYEDIKKVNWLLHGGRIDILTGGFPCQPFSQAGKRKGTKDDRHLWPEMLRAIQDIQPRWIVGENVHGIVNWDGGLVFDQVQSDLEAEGYEVQPIILPACGVNAPHRRDRVWFIAHSNKRDDRRTARKNEKESGKEWLQERNKIWKSLKSDKVQQFTLDSTIEGLERSAGEGIQRGVRGPSIESNEGTTPDTESLRVNREKKSENDNRQGGKRWRYNTYNSVEIQKRDITPDPNNTGSGNGLRVDRDRQKENERRERLAQSKFRKNGDKSDAPNPTSRRQPIKEHGKEESRRVTKKSVPTDWQNFPTQSPVCGRNDGFSSRLDGVTFPKWRNESIKAYGNAIVPQVALEIFKVIQKMNESS